MAGSLQRTAQPNSEALEKVALLTLPREVPGQRVVLRWLVYWGPMACGLESPPQTCWEGYKALLKTGGSNMWPGAVFMPRGAEVATFGAAQDFLSLS